MTAQVSFDVSPFEAKLIQKIASREACLRLRRVTSAQYTIYGGHAPDDWCIQVYVGSRKIVMHGWEGALHLPHNWTLCDVVRAVIEKLEGERGNG